MCITCGCSDPSLEHAPDAHAHPHGGGPAHHAHDHDHSHDHDHDHDHDHPHLHAPATTAHRDAAGGIALHRPPDARTLTLEARVLEKNDRLAADNRALLRSRGIVGLNVVSSPGSGKTTLLARTLRDLGGRVPMSVIEGDQATSNDARRIREAGGRAVQINTGTGCHLEADMVGRALTELRPEPGSIVFVENVGNLVCPALFDLGEDAKVAVLSVTEGSDKPAKYPHMFRAASLMLVNKIDLAPYVDFDVDACIAAARTVNPRLEVLLVSATRGDGLDGWYRWLEARRTDARTAATA